MKKSTVLIGAVIALLCMPVAGFAQCNPATTLCLHSALEVDFAASCNALYNDLTQSSGLLYGLVSDEGQRNLLAGALNPSTGDINGTLDIEALTYQGNGMLDANCELAIITTIMDKASGWSVNGLNSADTIAAWDFNANHWKTDDFASLNTLYPILAGAFPGAIPLLPHLFDILVGFSMLGDDTGPPPLPAGTSGSIQFIRTLYGLIPSAYLSGKSYDPSHFNAMGGKLAWNGDADADGKANLVEYAAGSANYTTNALDPLLPGDPPIGAEPDADQDGLSDARELMAGTNKDNPDTDNDGVTDGMEVLVYGTDPLDAGSKPSPVPMSDYAMLMMGLMLGVAGLAMARKASAKA